VAAPTHLAEALGIEVPIRPGRGAARLAVTLPSASHSIVGGIRRAGRDALLTGHLPGGQGRRLAALGQSNQASFMRPISSGSVHAEARPRHRGRTTWVWDTEITDDDGRLCALVRMTVAVRPASPEA
jgi:uncharacterized protein (TIGR00369 family)